MKIVFFGTPDFAATILASLMEEHEVSLVVTAPDRKRGRGKKVTPSPVKELALKNDIPVFQPENINTEESIEVLSKENADVFVVVAYGFIIKPAVLELPATYCINIHGSILPKYRGAAPIERAIIEGEEETGIAIMKMEAGMDTGPVATIRTTPIDQKSASTLREELALLGVQALREVLEKIEKQEVVFVKQDDTLATIAPKITKEEGQVRPTTESSFATLRKIQGLDTYGGAFILLQGIKYKLYKAEESNKKVEPGRLVVDGKKAFLGCKDGSIEILEIQAPNKGRMEVQSYLLGNSLPTDSKVEE